MEDSAKKRAADLVMRTGKAAAHAVERWAATDLATLTDALGLPDDPQRKALFLEDLTETYLRALSHVAISTYALCLLQADVTEAGRVYRSEGVQQELRTMAMRITESVLSK